MTAHEYPVSPGQRETSPAGRVLRKGIGEDGVTSGPGDGRGSSPQQEQKGCSLGERSTEHGWHHENKAFSSRDKGRERLLSFEKESRQRKL